MSEVIECPECQRKLTVREEHLGQEAKCPSCGATFVASAMLKPASPPPPPPPVERPVREIERRRDHDRDDRRERRRDFDRDDNDRRPRLRDPYDEDRDYGRLAPDRGAAVLTLGILGLVFSCIPAMGWILGGIALGMGNGDLQQMARGRMSRAGEGPTQGGKICGLIAIILNTLALFFWCMAFARERPFWD
jgi:hypothetical protein